MSGRLQQFRPFARLVVRHPYFEGEQPRSLRFLPGQETARFLEGWGFVVRAGEDRLELHAPEDRLEALWANLQRNMMPAGLAFLVGSTDAACASYTETTPEPSWRLGAVDGDWVETAAVEEEAFPRPKGAWTPLAPIVLPLAQGGHADFEAWRAGLGQTWSLSLKGRAFPWKYLLLGDWSPHDLRVQDLDGRQDFELPEEEALPDGQRALVFRSLEAIPLEERGRWRFQLRDVATQPERVLIKRLPLAVPSRLHRETVRGDPRFVCEIFVHR